MILDTWAKRHGIPGHAMIELKRELGLLPPIGHSREPEMSEAGIQTVIRLEASRKGARLWRNNVGATTTPEGSFIRYGLANDSKRVNAQIKSSDLVGIKPVLITPDLIGHTIGQFLCREVKHSTWRYSGNEREEAQLAWINLINSLGGNAAFAVAEGSI